MEPGFLRILRFSAALSPHRPRDGYFTTTPRVSKFCFIPQPYVHRHRERCATERPPHATWSYARSYTSTCPPKICAPYLER